MCRPTRHEENVLHLIPPIDAIALVVALGALAGGAPTTLRFALLAVAGLGGGIAFAMTGVVLPWWAGPVWALSLGVIVYAGVPLAGRSGLPVVVAAGLVGGMALAPAGLVPAGLGLAAAVVLLAVTAALVRLSVRQGGGWSCQTARLVGGLAAFAGAAALFQGAAA